MKTRAAPHSRTGTARTMEAAAPAGMREVLERTRLNLRALFRSLDHLGLAQELPRELRTLFELDADVAEALWALDQRPGRLDVELMVRDTAASLAALPAALRAFLARLAPDAQTRLAAAVKAVRDALPASAAYLDIPGRDPAVR